MRPGPAPGRAVAAETAGRGRIAPRAERGSDRSDPVRRAPASARFGGGPRRVLCRLDPRAVASHPWLLSRVVATEDPAALPPVTAERTELR
jgi:hypothetical protein